MEESRDPPCRLLRASFHSPRLRVGGEGCLMSSVEKPRRVHVYNTRAQLCGGAISIVVDVQRSLHVLGWETRKKFFRFAIKWLKIRCVILQSAWITVNWVLKISFDIIRERVVHQNYMTYTRVTPLLNYLNTKLRFIYICYIYIYCFLLCFVSV